VTFKIERLFCLAMILVLFVSACSYKTATPTFIPPPTEPHPIGETPTLAPVMSDTPTAETIPVRVLSICLGQEPASLFYYGNSSDAAQSIFEAIYDGPYDTRGFQVQPVILEKMPSFENGNARMEGVQVKPGDLIVDNSGNWTNLAEGVLYRPVGCTAQDCAQKYTGTDPVTIERLVVRFKILPGLRWSDGAPLTADDSVYSFEIAKSLFPAYRPDLINLTQAYNAVDDTTIEWVGPPGYQGPRYSTFFFTPLPRHAWGAITTAELATSPISSQTPIGWGPYKIDQWVPGDHISLSKNLNYFRAAEGLPKFDKLVYRFVNDGKEALDALKAGECDLADASTQLETQAAEVFDLQASGELTATVQAGTAWEQAVFNLAPIDEKKPKIFSQKETRQAVAYCTDREKMASELFSGRSYILNSYVLPSHPLANPDVPSYPFDPAKGGQLLTSAGWLDADNDPSTPRVASGVPGVPDGTPFEFTFLTTKDAEKPQAANIFQESLAQCGIKVNVELMSFADLLAAGPDGPVFGRKFDMAQFGWMTTLEPPCSLYRKDEIPGPYPASPKGWGGSNASGFSNAEFDQACGLASVTFPDNPAYASAHRKAQALFAEQLPAIPLYVQIRLAAARPGLCGFFGADPVENDLWNIENITDEQGCK
jgi:peptide/nickel transport system substrate-binding protein